MNEGQEEKIEKILSTLKNKFTEGDKTKFSFIRWAIWERHCGEPVAKVIGKKSVNKGGIITYIFYVCPVCLKILYLYLKCFPRNKRRNPDHYFKTPELSTAEFNQRLKEQLLASIAKLKSKQNNQPAKN